MSACPNPNDQSWKDLLIALGNEADAMTAFVRNNNEIPSVDKAKELLKDTERYSQPDVCKYFLVSFCPHDLFPNTK